MTTQSLFQSPYWSKLAVLIREREDNFGNFDGTVGSYQSQLSRGRGNFPGKIKHEGVVMIEEIVLDVRIETNISSFVKK